MRRVVMVLLFAGCGYGGLGTGGPLDGASDHDGGATFDAAPDPSSDGAVPVVDAASDAESVEVPCSTGALCRATGKCFTKCDKDSCPGQEERCFTCRSGPPHAVCGSACGSSTCSCMRSSDCPLPDELCVLGVCVQCNAFAVGVTCQNGEMCRQCASGSYHCRKSRGKGC